MKKYIYLLSIILLASLCLFPLQQVHAEDNLSQTVEIDGVRYAIFQASKTPKQDRYAIIENYSDTTNAKSGVYTIPTEIAWNGSVYPIVGVNSSHVYDKINEVIVPREFGSQKVTTNSNFKTTVGASNYFAVPDVKKLTIYADNINIASLYYEKDKITLSHRYDLSKPRRLGEVNIDSENVTINKLALSDISNLKAVTVSENSKVTLRKNSIVNCPKLSSISLPKNTKFMEGAVFSCNKLNDIEFPQGSNYTVKNGLISSAGTLLFVPSNVKEYKTPSGIKKIGDSAFSNCNQLESVALKEKTIGKYAFAQCKALTNVTISKTVEIIEDCAFSHSGIKSITIPKNVTVIGDGVFHGSESLASIKVSGDKYKFQNNALTTISGKTLLAIIPKDNIVKVPSGVITMKSMCVTAPPEVKNLKFPSSIRTIYNMGESMFKLSKITFASKVIPKTKK